MLITSIQGDLETKYVVSDRQNTILKSGQLKVQARVLEWGAIAFSDSFGMTDY